ncbi:4a-hydroxytetrahydrobiopterin dehydratase [Sphaerisporangium aureirubrum]|uniref:Putative pterin-4-alpha-carbinolamine dehydratase n=1 Tax=Sphaerisporangium aureirubrum TaxID=1544736 RepID=A0ABW1NQ41_9ACTN
MGLRDPLPADMVARRLESSGWKGGTEQISRTYDVAYDTAIRIVAEIGEAAIELEHRPDIDIRWDRLRIVMTTHTAGDVVTELDFLLAERIDQIVRDHA